jgi:hypothetical protein
MSRKPEGDRAMTAAERQARLRDRKATQVEAMRKALTRIQRAKTLQAAQEVAASALQRS